MGWLYLALLLELLYGLTIATCPSSVQLYGVTTHHIMFSFRFFVPYLPSTAILLAYIQQEFWCQNSQARPYAEMPDDSATSWPSW